MAVTYNSTVYNRQPNAFPGMYRFRRATLVTTRKSVDISDKIAELEIYEGIDQAFLTCQVKMVDTENLIYHGPIIGDETLELEIDDESDGFDRLIKFDFKIWHVSDRHQPKFGFLSYVLHGCSLEMYRDSHARVSKSYSLWRYEEAAADILKNYLESDKTFLRDKTDGEYCFVIPNWRPSHAITWLASRCRSETQSYGGGNFWFFETYDRFNCLSLDNLFDSTRNAQYCELTVPPIRPTEEYKLVYDKRVPKNTLRFEHYSVERSVDMLDSMRAGMVRNRMYEVDLVKRSVEQIDWNYKDHFGVGKHLEGVIDDQGGAPLLKSNHESLDSPESQWYVVPRQLGLHSKEKDGGYKYRDWAPNKLSQLTQASAFSITGVLPGHVGLKAGMRVVFQYPDVKNMSTEPDKFPDFYYSGSYLVTHVKRTFQPSKYWLSIRMIRDSLSVDLSL